MRLANKVALVTGGGSGIGRAICLAFAREGARVAVNDVRADAAAATVAALGAAAADALAVPADVADAPAVAAMVDAVRARYGRLDVLIANAGIGEVEGSTAGERLNRVAEAQLAEGMAGGPIETHWDVTTGMSDAEWDRMLRVHLYGSFYCAREALKVMAAQNAGAIVFMSSVAARIGLEAAPHYSAAKAGILGLMRALAREVGARGIRVNAIAPGFIETPMTAPFSPLLRQAFLMQTPLRRVGAPEDVAAAAVYLASAEAAFVTGQIVSPNGGIWMP